MSSSIFRVIFVIITLGLLFPNILAVAGNDSELTIGLTDEEMTRLDEIGINYVRTTPPPGPIRAVAEWERATGVLIRWPLGIPVDLIAEMSEDVMVTTLVGSSSEQNSAINSYTAGGVNMANTEFIIASTNTYWTRDYGPWFIFDGNDELAISDHIYNRPRPQDDQIPWTLGSLWGMNVYGMDLITTGGNRMCDGLGVSVSTELVYNENPSLSQAEVDSIMMAFLGDDYLVLDYIESGGIHHIDCWAKFLNPTTILVKDVAPSNSSYALLNARAEQLSQTISSWGVPYTVLRVYCPYGTAYTNSLILNNKVLVPTFGSSYDDDAIQTYQDAMPGYEVIGFDGSWLDDDAIHCRAKGIFDREMLYIEHTPLTTTADTLNDYFVSVKIKAYSGQPLIGDSLKIFWRSKSVEFGSVPLFATTVPDSFYGYIPAQKAGRDVYYYIQAADNSGRVETHPIIGKEWAHTFNINPAPSITSPDYYLVPCDSEFVYCPEYTDGDTSIAIIYRDYPAWMSVANDTISGTVPATVGIETFTVEVSDPYSTATQTVTVESFKAYICGDANGDGDVNVADAVYNINYIFKGGAAPDPLEAGDASGDGEVNVGDAVYIINYIFKGGSAPVCP